MRSGMMLWVVPWSDSTPWILMVSVPAPRISAPILLSSEATSTTSGSLATFSSTVLPSALLAAIIRLIVAPTETISKNILAPFSFSATRYMAPCSFFTLAPSFSNPLMCWSIGLGPSGHPPGSPITHFLNRASIAPII